MEDSGADDGDLPNWSLLESELDGATLAALRSHLECRPPAVVDNRQFEFKGGPCAVESNHDFKSQKYWEKRFAVEDEYEWLADFRSVHEILSDILPEKSSNPRILVVGCGNSNFSADLHDAGWKNITSIDFSPAVIARMRERHEERTCMKWVTMDMLTLEGFGDQSFDIVVDKAAMDALVCDEGSAWDPNTATQADAASMCAAVSRVLVQGAAFIQISFAQPHFRTKYLTGFGVNENPYGWEVSHKAFGDPGCLQNYIYVCRKTK